MLIISDKARISRLADIEDSVRGSRIVVEDGAMIDSFVKIKPAGGSGDVIIGPHTMINSGTVIYTGNGVTIGAHVLIAANCTLAATNHEYRTRDRRIDEQGFLPSRGGIVVEDDVWIGAGAFICPGVRIGRGAVVGARAVITKNVPPWKVVAGNPARIIKDRVLQSR